MALQWQDAQKLTAAIKGCRNKSKIDKALIELSYQGYESAAFEHETNIEPVLVELR